VLLSELATAAVAGGGGGGGSGSSAVCDAQQEPEAAAMGPDEEQVSRMSLGELREPLGCVAGGHLSVLLQQQEHQ